MSANQRRQSAFSAFMRTFSPNTPGVGERLACIPRMIKATVKREYDGGWRLLGMLGAAFYIISPIDALPELVFLAFGLIDDAVVISWLLGALAGETERFLEWEKAQGRGPGVLPGEVINK